MVVPKYLSDTFSLQILLKTLISSHFIAMYCHVTFHTIHPSLPSGKPYLCFKLCLNITSSRKSFLYRRFFIPLLQNLICLVCINIYLMYYYKNFEGREHVLFIYVVTEPDSELCAYNRSVLSE